MDFDFTPDQELLVRSFRAFFEAECDEDIVRAVEDEQLGYARDLWTKMAEFGMLGLPFPEEYGGGGAGMVELAALYEEGGRALWPAPHLSTVVLAGLSLLYNGSPAQRQRYLPEIAAGRRLFAFALVERTGDWTADGVETTAVREGEEWQLNGTKLFVKDAEIADHLLVVARTNLRGPRETGLSLFVVDAGSPGLTIRPFPLVSGEQVAEVTLAGVRVPAANLVGRPDAAWAELQPVLDRARICLAAQMAGATQALLDKTVEYTRQRVTFGRPLGANQVIHHRLADVYLAGYGARYNAYYAAWLAGEGLPCTTDAAVAKAFASKAYRLCTNESMQMHGGYGFSTEFYVQLYWRRMRENEVFLGDSLAMKDLATAR